MSSARQSRAALDTILYAGYGTIALQGTAQLNVADAHDMSSMHASHWLAALRIDESLSEAFRQRLRHAPTS
jgi:hypothetical protein